MRRCAKCKEMKSLTQFYRSWRSNRNTYYYSSYCKVCFKVKTDLYIHSKKGLEKKRISGRRWEKTLKGKEYQKDKLQKLRKKYPEKYKARYALNNAIKLGKLTKRPCLECGETITHGHHDDYSKPLLVVWLCRKHHLIRHNQLLI